MDANEVVARLVLRHRWLIVAAVALGASLAAAFAVSSGQTYAATARLQASAVAPSSDTEAAAISDRVKGIATSPQVVQSAIIAARVDRTEASARREVSVARIGSSGVVDVTVTDKDPAVALSLSRALSKEVAQWIDRLPHDVADPLLTDIDSLSRTLGRARQSLAGTGEDRTPDINNALSDLQTARQQLIADSTAGASASIISSPYAAHATSSHLPLMVALGALAGLVVSLLIAAIRESLRPTVADAAAFAAMVQAPLLGRVDRDNRIPPEVLTSLILGAQREGVAALALTGPAEAGQLQRLQRALTQALAQGAHSTTQSSGQTSGWNGHSANSQAQVRTRATARSNPEAAVAVQHPSTDAAWHGSAEIPVPSIDILGPGVLAGSRRGTGLVAVVNAFTRASAVIEVRNVCQTSGWPLVGVIDGTNGRSSGGAAQSGRLGGGA